MRARGTSFSRIERLIAEALSMARASAGRWRPQLGAEATPEQARALSGRDYRRPLLKAFGRVELCEILSEARRKVWPHLNREPVRLVSPREFIRHWSGLGVDFQVTRWSWPKGLAVLGFYLEKTKGLAKRPMICVNTAHYPAVVGVTFDHEMGHHLTSLIFDSHPEPVRLSSYTGYARHLDDPMEMAADILVSFGIYPEGVARKIFGKSNAERAKRAEQTLTGADLAKVLDYVAARYGLQLHASRSRDEMLQWLTGLIHYSKLRQALLERYDL